MLRKTLCILLVALMLTLSATAETSSDSVCVHFEDGFSLSLPSDWVSYEVPSEAASSGVVYCLGSADGVRLLYIQRWSTPIDDLETLRAELESNPSIVLRSDTAAGSSAPFLMYNLASSDASGCITLFSDGVLNLLFTPQSDADYMLLAATIMESCALHPN